LRGLVRSDWLAGEGGSKRDYEPLPELFSTNRWRVLARELGLTRRQTDVARLICRGMTATEIARELRFSVSAVHLHTDALFKRLRVRRRVNAVIRIVLVGRCKRCVKEAVERT